jgi:hypothetical protein
VKLSASTVDPQLSKILYGATHVMTRQVTGPLHPMCVLHCPYLKLAQQVCRLSQVSESGHSQLQATHPEEQKFPQPAVHEQRGWQSMMKRPAGCPSLMQ